jgi:hypothetical protein
VKRKFFFTEHALDEIDNDGLAIEDIMAVAENGETIETYDNDKPYPSFLNLGWADGNIKYPIHVVAAVDNEKKIHVITAYKPSPFRWDETFKIRKK